MCEESKDAYLSGVLSGRVVGFVFGAGAASLRGRYRCVGCGEKPDDFLVCGGTEVAELRMLLVEGCEDEVEFLGLVELGFSRCLVSSRSG